MTVLTAFEMRACPDDLMFSIVRNQASGLYQFFVSRGPGHSFKPLLSSAPLTRRSEVLEAIRETLEVMMNIGRSSRTVNPINYFDLNPPAAGAILRSLREADVVSTWELFAA